jgi:transcriptional regulator with XRE-family HTH domain
MSRKQQVDSVSGLIAFFGAELRRRRRAAGLSVEQLAPELHASASLAGKVENSDRTPQPDFGKECDAFFGTDMFEELALAIKKQARAYPSGFPDFVDDEARATSIENWGSLNVPGLLQTEDYARALFRASRPSDTTEEIEQHVATRLERQDILERPKPPRTWFALDEVVLRRPVGGAQVMAAQLTRIVAVGERPGVVVQIIPIAIGAHAGLLGEFTLLTRPDGMRVAYTESITSAQPIERPEEVAEFVLAYDTLRIEALTPRESLDVIRTIQGEFENEATSR